MSHATDARAAEELAQQIVLACRAEVGDKGGAYDPSARDRFAAQVAAILAQMGAITDEALRITLYLLWQEYAGGGQNPTLSVSKIAESTGLSRGRAELALLALANQGWVEPVGSRGWRMIRIEPAWE